MHFRFRDPISFSSVESVYLLVQCHGHGFIGQSVLGIVSAIIVMVSMSLLRMDREPDPFLKKQILSDAMKFIKMAMRGFPESATQCSGTR